MALRDSRRGFKPLLLSMSCVILGVASVVVAFSFRDNLQSSIRTQSKSLLGADLAIDGGELTGLPSTVVDLTRFDEDGEWTVLREGGLSTGDLAAGLAPVGKAD